MEVKKELGSRITSALALRGKKQKELANAIGVTDNTISYYCSGSRSPNIEQLLNIADYLDVSTDYLLGRTSDPNLSPSATDELGLSAEAVGWIVSKSSDPFFGTEFQKYFSRLLEMRDFQLLIDSLFDCFAAAKVHELDLAAYQTSIEEHSDNIVESYEAYKSKLEAYENANSLDCRVSFFVQAHNEFESLYEKFPAFACILGDGENLSSSHETTGLQSIVEARANCQLSRILTEIESTLKKSGK